MTNEDPINNPNLPAFPQDSNNHYAHDVGLSKREYFAGLAMQGLAANSYLLEISAIDENRGLKVVKLAVDMADALLEALEVK